MYWIVKYEDYDTLVDKFGTSDYVISNILNSMMPYMVEYFMKFIKHKRISKHYSEVSRNILFIIDGTIHKRRKPRLAQSNYYRSDKGCHFITTQLLIDYDGWIVAVYTGIWGRVHDNSAATSCDLFRKIVGKFFALGDPGYQKCDYIVAGIGKKSLKGKTQRAYYRKTKREQIKIEHVNNFFKMCKSVCKDTRFIHSDVLQAGCVLICCGLYNMRKEAGEYIPASKSFCYDDDLDQWIKSDDVDDSSSDWDDVVIEHDLEGSDDSSDYSENSDSFNSRSEYSDESSDYSEYSDESSDNSEDSDESSDVSAANFSGSENDYF